MSKVNPKTSTKRVGHAMDVLSEGRISCLLPKTKPWHDKLLSAARTDGASDKDAGSAKGF